MENPLQIIIVFLAKPPDFAINSDATGSELAASEPTAEQWPELAVEAVSGLKTE